MKKELPKVERNILLKNYTTFKIGGPAKYFFKAETEQDLVKAVKVARKNKLPFFILGGGSNVLILDKGYKGLVINFQFSNSQSFNFKKNRISACGGKKLENLVNFTVKSGWSGLEWAAGLPGTLGGAIRGNAGAFGEEMKDNVVSVKCLDKRNKLTKLTRKECQFSYRSSIFKKKNWIVLSAVLKFEKGNKRKLYSLAKDHIKHRKERQPLSYPSAGSVFRNCDIKKIPKKIKDKFSDSIKKDPFPVLPAAFIISEAGLKGKKIGNAKISEKHPNFIINLGGARAKEVKDLINFVKKKVKKSFGIDLKEEIEIV